MKLNEIAGGFNAGMWVSPAGQIVEVASTHIDDIINYPAKFGLTIEYINDAYKRYGEQLHQEGEAREEIIKDVLQRGWIRVRRYKNYWSMTLFTLSNQTKRIVKQFVHTLMIDGIMGKYDELRILELRNDNMKTIDSSEIIDDGLEESIQRLPFVTFNQVASLLVESSLSRLHSKINKHECGSITAFRGEFTYKQNRARNKVLSAKIMSAGYSVTAIVGTYVENYESQDANEVNEQSFFVAAKDEGNDNGKLRNFLISLGESFDQDSILYIPYNGEPMLIGTSKRENAWPALGATVSVGKFKGGKAAQFMSKINGRVYTFEDFDMPTTNNGKWSLKLLSEQKWENIVNTL